MCRVFRMSRATQHPALGASLQLWFPTPMFPKPPTRVHPARRMSAYDTASTWSTGLPGLPPIWCGSGAERSGRRACADGWLSVAEVFTRAAGRAAVSVPGSRGELVGHRSPTVDGAVARTRRAGTRGARARPGHRPTTRRAIASIYSGDPDSTERTSNWASWRRWTVTVTDSFQVRP